MTPFRDVGAIFEETARSVLRQSFQQWEWLIVNDGSVEPGSLAILDRYRGAADPRIRVIDHPTDQGLSAARNTGFRAATTPFVVQLDGDDLLEPTAIEKWYWYMDSHPEIGFCKGFSLGFGSDEYLWERGFHEGVAFLEENPVDATAMVRRAVWDAAGGYDEHNRDGLEDWDFWLRCAAAGHWGGTVPEYLNWYRRRVSQAEDWGNWSKRDGFRARLRERYPSLWERFPVVQPHWHTPLDEVSEELPCENRLAAGRRRALLVTSRLGGEGESPDLALVRRVTELGWETTAAAMLNRDHSTLAAFTELTPDVFVLDRFLRVVDYPRFLRYLIGSRGTEVVMLSSCEAASLLVPYLCVHCPEVAIIDIVHAADHKHGAHRRTAAASAQLVDLAVSLSELDGERGSDSIGRKLEDLLERACRGRASPAPAVSRSVERLCTAAAVSRIVADASVVEWEEKRVRDAEQGSAAQHLAALQSRTVEELRAWIGELETGKAWLEQEWRTWQKRSEEIEQDALEKQAWIDELEAAKASLEQQCRELERSLHEAEAGLERRRIALRELERSIRALVDSRWVGIGRRLGLVSIPSPLADADSPAARDHERT